MSTPELRNAWWTRKHDDPRVPLIPDVPEIVYPQTLKQLIEICEEPGGDDLRRGGAPHLHAAGSHWALSTAAVSDHTFVETNDVHEWLPALGRTLYEVVPGCLSQGFLEALNEISLQAPDQAPFYPVHVESGKRIYQLYAELDQDDTGNPQSLCELMNDRFGNARFKGSWAFATLGGAGGQTIIGALTTGTHGGDFDRGPVADSVWALHLVTDGGKHFWIEREVGDIDGASIPRLTDEDKLRALYGVEDYGGPDRFEVIYADDVFDAALMQVGRFGIVYSVVLRAVRQYMLVEQLKLDKWEAVKADIADPGSQLFNGPYPPKGQPPQGKPPPQNFLQIVVCPVASDDGGEHVCGITRRWTPEVIVPAGLPDPAGREERVGKLLVEDDPRLNAPRFANAGTSFPYEEKSTGSILDMACANPNVSVGAVEAVYDELEDFIKSHTIEVGGALAAALTVGGSVLLPLLPELVLILALLALFLEAVRDLGPAELGEGLEDLRQKLLGNPKKRAAGLWIWRAIAIAVFEAFQKESETEAISYAVMDGFDYRDVSCLNYGYSVEVFFDAADPNLIAFVDRLLMFENDQECENGEAVAGYISMRFTGQTRAQIGPEAFPRTCAVECSGLADVQGSGAFVEYAETLALDPNIKGILHWGQRNESRQADTEFRFGDGPSDPTGPLHEWRQALALLSENGRRDRFSSEFTRQVGLEIVQPAIGAFEVSGSTPGPPRSYTVSWDCTANPPGTAVAVSISPPAGAVQDLPYPRLSGEHTVEAAQPGDYTVILIASFERNGVTRHASRSLTLAGG